MAVITPAIGTPGATAKGHRQAFSALAGQDVETFVNSATAVGAGHGLVRAGHLEVSEKSGTANMSVDVAAGIALITGDSSLAQGVYVATNDAVTNLVISAADATNDRWDLVVMQVRDNAEDSSGSTDARLYVVTGTPAGSPADPTIPDGCLVLARVVVEALASSIVDANITNLAGLAQGSSWNQAWGVVPGGFASVTSPQTGITATADVTSLTATWTAVAGRLYQIEFILPLDVNWTSGVQQPVVYITDGSNTVKQTITLPEFTEAAPNVSVPGFVVEESLSGSTTRKLRASGGSGTGDSVDVNAAATAPAQLVVRDIGPA